MNFRDLRRSVRSQKKGLNKDALETAYAKSRFTVMREDTMESQGLNSSEALPYITVDAVIKHVGDQ